jgi:exopolysaccharide biosynthesis protein
MQLTKTKINSFLFFKLPSAYWCGIRTKSLSSEVCEVTVTHKWFNQNPFKSMYFAVQAMAAELSTGALVMSHISESNKKVSMLVAENKAVFTKKATGKITFTCNDGLLVKETINKAIETKQGQTVWLTSVGVNENGEQVSEMKFLWTVLCKN